MASEKKGKDLLIGAIVGGLLGAATALLFAPKSGRELRNDIAENAKVVSDKTVQLATSVSQKTQEVAKSVSTTTSDIVGKAKDTATNVVGTVRSWKESKIDDAELQDDVETSEAAEDLVILGNR
ncbi:YtxH domain-containing protein [Paenibacillus chondroitinus]|uniref:YtxH domain-containing protein n=1 Tax=Paenibacillus chondroitinus TaxID=59842 RepID=A0ABU6DBC6_9BACL|nr:MULTISPECIES: YtxH domain-containing protein [Paenibacillus]MCY9663240.1 YtxH domain-containing protein [Paenibacillus anseongense]MEB4795056.1 YtxH domain-containing protein [Paenibacillus chondroitinus]